MKIDISNQIKDELLKSVKCKECNSFYENKNISIKKIWWNKSFVTAYCDKCDLESHFEANISEEKNGIEKNKWKIISNKKNNQIKFIFNKNIWNSIIQENEIKDLENKMQNFSSFKNLFSLILVFSVFFTWCNSDIEETRQNILNWIENIKDTTSWAYNNWKEIFENTKDIIETTPEKIEKAKADIEQIVEDANKLKLDLEEKVEDTKNAIDETKKAVDAISDAMDAINSIWWTWDSESWENN